MFIESRCLAYNSLIVNLNATHKHSRCHRYTLGWEFCVTWRFTKLIPLHYWGICISHIVSVHEANVVRVSISFFPLGFCPWYFFSNVYTFSTYVLFYFPLLTSLICHLALISFPVEQMIVCIPIACQWNDTISTHKVYIKIDKMNNRCRFSPLQCTSIVHFAMMRQEKCHKLKHQ